MRQCQRTESNVSSKWRAMTDNLRNWVQDYMKNDVNVVM